MFKSVLFSLSFSALLIGCVEKNAQLNQTDYTETEFVLGNFGHLTAVNEYNTSPIFLSTLKKDRPYNICLSEKMTKKFPGIEEEIKASINIWAHYIDRKISINVVLKNLPFPDQNWTFNDFINTYENICDLNSDLIIAETHPSGSRLGYTQQSASFYPSLNGGHKELQSWKRILNLTSWPSSEDKKFVSLEQVTGVKRNSDEILDLLKKRNKTIYLNERNRHLTLTTLIHEFGHVWGLCDQYPLENNTTNCDPQHSTLSPQGHVILNEEASMASSGWIHHLGLHNDDIEGIIDLASRNDVAQTLWPLPSKTVEDFGQRQIIQGPARHFVLKSAEVNSGKLALKISLDVDGNSKIFVHLKYADSETWRNQGPSFVFNDDVKTPEMNLIINGDYSKKIDKVKLIYTKEIDESMITDELLSESHLSNEIQL